MAPPPDAPPSRSDADELLADDDDDFDDETCIEAFVFTLQEVVYSRWFNNAVLFVILANSVCMALEDPVIEDKWSEPGQAALAYLGFVFIGLFTIEMTLKLLALGVVEYLRDVWNALDGFIVLVSYVNLMFASAGGASFTVLRVLRILRALRPLRTIKRIQGLRILVVSLLKHRDATLLGPAALAIFCFSREATGSNSRTFVELGAVPLLSSHCIVIAHHLLDSRV